MVSTVTVAESPGCASAPGVTVTEPSSPTVTVQFALPLLFGSSVIVAVVVEPAGILSPVFGTVTGPPSLASESFHFGSNVSAVGFGVTLTVTSTVSVEPSG